MNKIYSNKIKIDIIASKWVSENSLNENIKSKAELSFNWFNNMII